VIQDYLVVINVEDFVIILRAQRKIRLDMKIIDVLRNVKEQMIVVIHVNINAINVRRKNRNAIKKLKLQ